MYMFTMSSLLPSLWSQDPGVRPNLFSCTCVHLTQFLVSRIIRSIFSLSSSIFEEGRLCLPTPEVSLSPLGFTLSLVGPLSCSVSLSKTLTKNRCSRVVGVLSSKKIPIFKGPREWCNLPIKFRDLKGKEKF